MKCGILITLISLAFTPGQLKAQSSTTEALRKKHSDALELFFYNNTLRMLNQQEDKEFDELIRDIEKMRFLLIRKSESNFSAPDYKKLVSDYKSEAFEEIMSSRHDGKNFNVYLKEIGGKTKGMLVLINDTDNLFVLDILGSIALDKVTKLYSTLDESTDIGRKIRDFAGDNDESGKTDDSEKSAENR
jgi:hypothetical protein